MALSSDGVVFLFFIKKNIGRVESTLLRFCLSPFRYHHQQYKGKNNKLDYQTSRQ